MSETQDERIYKPSPVSTCVVNLSGTQGVYINLKWTKLWQDKQVGGYKYMKVRLMERANVCIY